MGAPETSDDSGIQSRLRKFGESTSMKGVSRALKSKTKCVGLVWLCAVLFGAAFAIFQLGTLFYRYFEYQKTLKVLKVSGKREFPDVTVCDVNFLASAGQDYMTFDQYLQVLMEKFGEKSVQWFGVVNSQSKWIPSDVKTEEMIAHLMSLTGYFENFPLPDLDNLTLDNMSYDLLLNCVYYTDDSLAVDCLGEVVRLFWTPSHNFCITLSLAGLNVKGVSLVLYTNDHSSVMVPLYVHELMHSRAKGMMVSLHPPNTYPDLFNVVNIPAGHETTINVEEIQRYKLPHPYGECMEEPESNPSWSKGAHPEREYTIGSCLELCAQRALVERCGCLSSYLLFTTKQAKEYRFCANFSASSYVEHIKGVSLTEEDADDGMNNATDSWMRTESSTPGDELIDNFDAAIDKLSCVSDSVLNGSSAHCLEVCPEACRSTEYSMSVSQAPWPHVAYQMAFYCEYIRTNPDIRPHFMAYEDNPGLPRCSELQLKYSESNAKTRAILEDIDLIEKNFLQLNIMFQSHETTVLEEEAAITWEVLFSNIGGTLNLWIGITFITFVEIFELGFEIVVGIWSNKRKNEGGRSLERLSSPFKTTRVEPFKL